MLDLTGSPALDVAIGLAFIFLVVSLLGTAIQEQIAAYLALRASTLEKGLRNMLENDADAPKGAKVPNAPADPSAIRPLVNELYAHPLIRSLYKSGRFLPRRKKTIAGTPWASGRLPSYIAPRIFALALMDTLAPNALAPKNKVPATSRDALAIVRSMIGESHIPDGLKHQLIIFVDDARGEIDDFRRSVEAWFDDSMARVSGWYKRHTQLIMIPIAIVIVVGLNANTLVMGDRLWNDSALREAVVQQAGKAKSPTDAGAALDEVKDLGVPLGWSFDKEDPRYLGNQNPLTVAVGWLLTVAAIMLGAPFWFDSLSRLSRLRGSGKPEAPLPASAYGKPGERVVTEARPVAITVQAVPPAR